MKSFSKKLQLQKNTKKFKKKIVNKNYLKYKQKSFDIKFEEQKKQNC